MSKVPEITSKTMKLSIEKDNIQEFFGLTYVSPMNLPRTGHLLLLSGFYVYAIGGNNFQKYYKECERYCIRTNKWEEIEPL